MTKDRDAMERVRAVLIEDLKTMQPTALDDALVELGVDFQAVMAKVNPIRAKAEAEAKRAWMKGARAGVERDRHRQFTLPTMTRSDMQNYLGGRQADQRVAAYFRKHSGAEPSDSDMRTFIEALMVQDAADEEDDG
jgi:hypothetical protein